MIPDIAEEVLRLIDILRKREDFAHEYGELDDIDETIRAKIKEAEVETERHRKVSERQLAEAIRISKDVEETRKKLDEDYAKWEKDWEDRNEERGKRIAELDELFKPSPVIEEYLAKKRAEKKENED